MNLQTSSVWPKEKFWGKKEFWTLLKANVCDCSIKIPPTIAIALVSVTKLSLYLSQSPPCLCVTTHSCATSPSVAPSWVALPGSQLALMFSAISTGLESLVAHQLSAQPAPRRCRESWILLGLSFHPLRTTRLWCWQVCGQTLFWTSVPVL